MGARGPRLSLPFEHGRFEWKEAKQAKFVAIHGEECDDLIPCPKRRFGHLYVYIMIDFAYGGTAVCARRSSLDGMNNANM